MVPGIASVARNEHVRVLVATGVFLAVLVVFTDANLSVLAPVVVIFLTVTVHNAADDVYDLPDGSNWLAYGAALVLAGVLYAIATETVWFTLMLVVPGLWFVLDGATAIRYEPDRSRHAYVADLEADDSSEVMFRMQTLNLVYQRLRDTADPQTVAEVAEAVDLTESRTDSALEYLVSRGQVERSGDRYEAVPPRWGRVTPMVDFLVWVPSRLVRPFRRLTTG